MTKKKLSDFDFSYFFDDNLTEVPNNPKSFYEGILHLEKEALNEKNVLKKIRLLSKTGTLCRTYGENLKSEEYLLKALNLTDKSEHTVEYIIANLRLSLTYKKLKKFELSLHLLSELESMITKNESVIQYMDFVYQHKGKVLFGMNKFSEALAYFEKALKLREIKGDEELISSTEFAIQTTKNRLTQIDNNYKL